MFRRGYVNTEKVLCCFNDTRSRALSKIARDFPSYDIISNIFSVTILPSRALKTVLF